MLVFGRDHCGDLRLSGEREWLVTNGLGGYASGTVAGLLTRRYHGLLVAALQPPVRRTLLLTKLDETATYGGRAYPLFTNCWARGYVEPTGFYHLERFHLEGTTPVWTFAFADALLEKRVWMEQQVPTGEAAKNTTYVRYDLRRGMGPLALRLEAVINHRDHHGNTHGAEWPARIERVPNGLEIVAFEGAVPLYLLSGRARATPQQEWHRGYWLSVEDFRGLDPVDDNLSVGFFEVTLCPGESLTFVASTASDVSVDGVAAYARRQEHERQLVDAAALVDAPAAIQHLVLAADQFVVCRSLPQPSTEQGAGKEGGRSVIAGYPWFSDWGRDTMISLPGLTLVTGRHSVAAGILRTFAQFVDRGMIPNRFPDEGEIPEYNTVDATLWYFEALRAYHAVTGDDALLRDLFPVLQDMIDWHCRGTRYQIRLDADDGLLYAGEPGVQLTWMDAKVGDWVVTPRTGKPIEINALWYNALCIVSRFARRLDRSPQPYLTLVRRTAAGFARFWNDMANYCYDVLDGPAGDDATLRPNQLFAVSLPHSPLESGQQRAVVDACARQLLTSHGLRSLAPDHPHYEGRYGGDRTQRDAAYHQGTVWGWLIGPFVRAHLRVYHDPVLAGSFLQPLLEHLAGHGLGSVSEIFDGDAPFAPRGCIAQAWSVAELLSAWQATMATEDEGREGRQ